MSKGLEALTRLRNDECVVLEQYNECYDIIEQELKALEIIKEKQIDVGLYELDYRCGNSFKLTKVEYELLKEIL